MTDVSVDDFLAHHGVKGMHWGKHKAGVDSGGTAAQRIDKANEVKATKAKVTSKDIKEARARQSEKADKVNQHYIDLLNQTSDAGRARAQKILDKSADKLVNNPDAATAIRMTAGEKVTAGFGVAIMGLAAVGVAANIATILK